MSCVRRDGLPEIEAGHGSDVVLLLALTYNLLRRWYESHNDNPFGFRVKQMIRVLGCFTSDVGAGVDSLPLDLVGPGNQGGR